MEKLLRKGFLLVQILIGLIIAPAFQVCSLLVLCQGALLLASLALTTVVFAADLPQSGVSEYTKRVYRTFGTMLTVLGVIGWFRPEWSAWSGIFATQPSVMLGSVTTRSIKMSVASPLGFVGNVSMEYWSEELSREKAARLDNLEIDRNIALLSIDGLEPSKTYRYSISLTPVGGPIQVDTVTGSFKTLPVSPSELSFVSTSCMQRRLLWGKTFSGFHLMEQKHPDFLLFLGDFVYSDVPRGLGYNGIGYGENTALYDQEYLAVRASKYVREFFSHVPVFTMFDDHEVLNDFAGRATDPARFDAAIGSWYHFVGQTNPGGDSSVLERGGRWFNFSVGHVDFFMLDTRSSRDEENGILLGSTQMRALENWLLDSDPKQTKNSKFRVVVSPVTMTRNRPEKHEGWNCAPRERDHVLGFIVSHRLSNIVFITGDTHKPGIFELAPGLFEIGASPLEAFGPRPWNGVQDRTVYEGEGMTTAFARYRVNRTHFEVEIFGGGVPVGLQVTVVLFVFSALAVVNLAAQNQKNSASLVASASWSAALACLVWLTLEADDLSEDPSFLEPVFRFVIPSQHLNQVAV